MVDLAGILITFPLPGDRGPRHETRQRHPLLYIVNHSIDSLPQQLEAFEEGAQGGTE